MQDRDRGSECVLRKWALVALRLLMQVGITVLSLGFIAGAIAVNSFVYGPLFDRLNSALSFDVAIVGNAIVYATLMCLGLFGLCFAWFVIPVICRLRKQAGIAPVGRDEDERRALAAALPLAQKGDAPREKERGYGPRRTSLAKRVGLYAASVILLGCIMYVPWGEWTYWKFLPRFGRGWSAVLTVLVHVLGALMGVTVGVCVLSALRWKRSKKQ